MSNEPDQAKQDIEDTAAKKKILERLGLDANVVGASLGPAPGIFTKQPGTAAGFKFAGGVGHQEEVYHGQYVSESDESLHFSGTEESVLELDSWDKAKGKQLYDKMREKLGAWSDEMQGLSSEDAGDFHGACFLPEVVLKPEEEVASSDKHKYKYMEEMIESPAFKELRKDTLLNRDMAEQAAETLMVEYAKQKREEEDLGTSVPGQPGGVAGSPEDAANRAFNINQAIKKAREEVDIVDESSKMFCVGPRGSPTDQAKRLHSEGMQALLAKVQQSAFLREFMRMAGRYKRTAFSKQRTKLRHGSDEITGIETGDDFAKMLPHELMQFGIPELSLSAVHKWIEKQSQIRETRSREAVGRGPIVVCVDESGSMEGSRINTAKALALGCWWIAQHQKRWCLLNSFGSESDPGEAVLWSYGSSKFKVTPEHILEWIMHFYCSSGTSLKVPLEDIPKEWNNPICAPKGKTDMILITDGGVRVPPRMAYNYMKWKQENEVSLYTIIIGVKEENDGDEIKVIRSLSDRLFFCDSLSLESEAVDAVFSI